MKLILIVLLLLCLCASVTQASGSSKRCYYRVSKCCYRHQRCGRVHKHVKRSKRCDYRKCDNVCKRKCRPGKKYQKCSHTPHGEVCYWKRRAKKCRKVCHEVCHLVKRYCVYYDVYRYYKYCAVLKCGKSYVRGRAVKPAGYTAKTGVKVRTYRSKKRNGH